MEGEENRDVFEIGIVSLQESNPRQKRIASRSSGGTASQDGAVNLETKIDFPLTTIFKEEYAF
jgi:hypothetical protein